MKENINDKLSDALTDVDDEYIMKTENPPEKSRNLWIRWTALAACLVLLVSAIPLWAMMKDKTPTYDNARFSAQDIANLFGMTKDGATVYYKKVYVPDPEYLYLTPLPTVDYLPVYEKVFSSVNKRELSNLADKCLPNIAEALGVDKPKYEVEQEKDDCRIDTDAGDYNIRIYQEYMCNYVIISRILDTDPLRRVILNGKTVTVDQTQSDEEIISSLSEIRAELVKMFGRDFPDAKVVRKYDANSENGVKWLSVYFYDGSEYSLNGFTNENNIPFSDYIELDFDNFQNYADDLVSKDHLTDVSIRYVNYRKDLSTISNHRVISLEEAETLLEAGYVFGGHSCKLCMEMQEAVDFSDYDFVGMTYIFGSAKYYDSVAKKFKPQNSTGIPFYVFYKQLELECQNGNLTYAKTYVPAIKVSGLKEYFESQEKEHRSNVNVAYPDDE